MRRQVSGGITRHSCPLYILPTPAGPLAIWARPIPKRRTALAFGWKKYPIDKLVSNKCPNIQFLSFLVMTYQCVDQCVVSGPSGTGYYTCYFASGTRSHGDGDRKREIEPSRPHLSIMRRILPWHIVPDRAKSSLQCNQRRTSGRNRLKKRSGKIQRSRQMKCLNTMTRKEAFLQVLASVIENNETKNTPDVSIC